MNRSIEVLPMARSAVKSYLLVKPKLIYTKHDTA